MTIEEIQMYQVIADALWWIAIGGTTMVVIIGCLGLYAMMRQKMTDREVGELYQDWLQCHKVNLIKPQDELELTVSTGVLNLIRKLVEERAERYSIKDCQKPRSWWGDVFPESYTNHALEDFGISIDQFNART